MEIKILFYHLLLEGKDVTPKKSNGRKLRVLPNDPLYDLSKRKEKSVPMLRVAL